EHLHDGEGQLTFQVRDLIPEGDLVPGAVRVEEHGRMPRGFPSRFPEQADRRRDPDAADNEELSRVRVGIACERPEGALEKNAKARRELLPAAGEIAEAPEIGRAHV